MTCDFTCICCLVLSSSLYTVCVRSAVRYSTFHGENLGNLLEHGHPQMRLMSLDTWGKEYRHSTLIKELYRLCSISAPLLGEVVSM